jgi:hypothetical protein
VAHSGKRPTAARSIPTDRRASGHGEHSRDRARVDPGAKIFTRPWLSASHGARIAAAGMNRGAEVADDELPYAVVLIQTLYHGIVLQSA